MQVLAWLSDLKIQSDCHLQNLFIDELVNRWNKQIENNNHILLLLEDDKIIGFVSYVIYIPQTIPYSAPDIEILNIYITPTLRRMGFGKLLCESLFSEIRQIHSNKIIVWILEEDIQAKFFYEKLGFYSTFNTRLV